MKTGKMVFNEKSFQQAAIAIKQGALSVRQLGFVFEKAGCLLNSKVTKPLVINNNNLTDYFNQKVVK